MTTIYASHIGQYKSSEREREREREKRLLSFTIVLIKITVPGDLLFTKIKYPIAAMELVKTVYQSRTNEEFYNVLAKEFLFSEKYCYWHVTREENGRQKSECVWIDLRTLLEPN